MEYQDKPEDALWLADFAKIAGIQTDTLRTYRTGRARKAMGGNPVPEPSGYAIHPPHVRPWWTFEVVITWIENRPGNHRRKPKPGNTRH